MHDSFLLQTRLVLCIYKMQSQQVYTGAQHEYTIRVVNLRVARRIERLFGKIEVRRTHYSHVGLLDLQT